MRGLHRSIPLGAATRVMGVLNLTPDSFSDGGQYLAPDAALSRVAGLVMEGAELLDLGAESTRPGAVEVSGEAEWKRLEPVLTRCHAASTVPISVDTRHAEVARWALNGGADMINDVSGLRDPEMRRVIARAGAPVVVMHMRGNPSTMQEDTVYADLRGEVFAALAASVARAIDDGIAAEKIFVDPGLGFGKTGEQNLDLLLHLGDFRALGHPLVIGASRKRFLGQAIGGAPVGERLEPGIAAAVIAAMAGTAYVRTHDVAPTVRALQLANAVRRGRFPPVPA